MRRLEVVPSVLIRDGLYMWRIVYEALPLDDTFSFAAQSKPRYRTVRGAKRGAEKIAKKFGFVMGEWGPNSLP